MTMTIYCNATKDLSDAQQVSDKLGIKLNTVNFSHEYWEDVFEHTFYLNIKKDEHQILMYCVIKESNLKHF